MNYTFNKVPHTHTYTHITDEGSPPLNYTHTLTHKHTHTPLHTPPNTPHIYTQTHTHTPTHTSRHTYTHTQTHTLTLHTHTVYIGKRKSVFHPVQAFW